ncbi:MAG: sel1 repeat family protein [Alphaproteobacteria bacterium]|nr:sel1 repeat family protein [Alphaproteobacteria bacterium]
MMSIRRILVALALLIAWVGPADAGLDESWDAARSGDYSRALKEVVTPIRQTLNSLIEQAGPTLERSVGTFEALIGDAYYYGHGVSRDYVAAVGWYRRAAAKGNAMAQSTLGDVYYYGRGMPQNFVAAATWWQLAADSGVAIAQLNLSVVCANGDGVPQDYVKAHTYANLAAARLPEGEDRNTAIKNRDIVAKLMTPSQLAEAQQLAQEWRPRKLD